MLCPPAVETPRGKLKLPFEISGNAESPDEMTSRIFISHLAYGPWSLKYASICSSNALLVRAENPRSFGLGILHRLLRRLRSRERCLDAVVERLGHALVVVRRELGDRVLQLIACNRSDGEALHVLLHLRGLPRIGTH